MPSKHTAEDLTNFYVKIFNSLGMSVDDEGRTSLVLEGDKTMPATISNRRLVVPYHSVLRNLDGDTQIAFHPLSENVYRGESPVIKKLKNLINFRLTTTITFLMKTFMDIASDQDYHEKLTPTQKELLEVVPKATQKTCDATERVCGTVSLKGKNRVINIFLKRGGEYKGEGCKRVAVTNFPIVEEFDPDSKEIFGIDMKSKKDAKAFRDLFMWLLPDADKKDAYSHGSQSLEAPYFDALVRAYIKVAERLNAATWNFRKHIEDYERVYIDVKGLKEVLSSLGEYQDLIPTLDGNQGDHGVAGSDGEQTQVSGAQPNKPKPSGATRLAQSMEADTPKVQEADDPPFVPDPKPGQSAQANTPAPAAESDSGKVSWADVQQRARQNQQSQQPAFFQQPPQPQPAFGQVSPARSGQLPQNGWYGQQQPNNTAPPGFGGAQFVAGQNMMNQNTGFSARGAGGPVYPGGV